MSKTDVEDVNRATVAVVVIAVLGVLAVGLIAGSIQSTASLEDGGGGGLVPGDGDGVLPTPSFADTGAVSLFGSSPLIMVILVLAAIAVVGAVIYILFNPRMLAFIVLLLVFLLVLSVLSGLLGSGGGGGVAADGSESQGSSEPGTQEETESPLSLVWAVLPLIGLVALAVGLVYLSNARGDPGDGETEAGESKTPDDDEAAALAQIAGRTAERIEAESGTDEALENEVYRAWQEMTDELQVANPESTTPGEFARAATDAGLEADAVDELTELFEVVRYGGQDPTTDRERRAIHVLERIEQSGQQTARSGGE